MSIRLRLTAWYSGILAVTLLLFGTSLYIFLNYSLYGEEKEKLKNRTDQVHFKVGIQLIPKLQGMDLNVQLDLYEVRFTGTFLQLLNLKNGQISRSDVLKQYDLTLPPPDAEVINSFDTKSFVFEKKVYRGITFLIYNKPVFIPGTIERVGVLQGAVIDPYESVFNILKVIIVLFALCTIMLAASVGWFLARKVLKPIDRVIEAADQIGNGADLDKRIAYEGPFDEIGRLTGTINGMLARIQLAYTELEEAYGSQRRFVSDASHELRTPLTTIRGNIDLLDKMWSRNYEHMPDGQSEEVQMSLEAMKDIAGEAERMSRLVSDLLSLARADAGVHMEKQAMKIMPVVLEVLRRASLIPHSAEWRVGHLGVLENVEVYGNRDSIQQMLFIFIENAFKYTEAGSVTFDALRSGSQIGLRISDTGIGMDKEEIPYIFDRFYRADPSRGKKAGTGLGLSIAKWIIDELGGSIEVKTRKGEGSLFIVWIPVRSGSTVHQVSE